MSIILRFHYNKQVLSYLSTPSTDADGMKRVEEIILKKRNSLISNQQLETIRYVVISISYDLHWFDQFVNSDFWKYFDLIHKYFPNDIIIDASNIVAIGDNVFPETLMKKHKEFHDNGFRLKFRNVGIKVIEELQLYDLLEYFMTNEILEQ